VPSVSPDELGALLMAHCSQARTELPPGKPGTRWAADFLGALPVACSRRLPDLLATGPKVFEFLVGQGFFAAMPSPRLVPQVLGLVAAVSPLLEARSSRQWALWLARVWDSRSPMLAAIRKRTPTYLIGITTPAPSGPPLRAAQIRDERDRLAAALADAAVESAQRQAALVEAHAEHNRLAAEVAAAVNRERLALNHAAIERGRLKAEMTAAAERERQAADAAAAQGARELQRERDRLAAELSSVRAENTRLSKSLVQAEETVELRSAERDMLGRVLSDERAAGERLRSELSALKSWVNDAQRPFTVDGRDVSDPADPLQQLAVHLHDWRRRRDLRRADELGAERRVQEAEAARGQALVEVDALKRENAGLRSDRDELRARCAALESESRARAGVRDVGGKDEKAERALAQLRQELMVAREGTKDLMDRLDRRTNTLLGVQETMETLEVELAAANAEIAQWKAGYSDANLILTARQMAANTVRKNQAARPSLEDDD
jgi:chromosome segregation ATPase